MKLPQTPQLEEFTSAEIDIISAIFKEFYNEYIKWFKKIKEGILTIRPEQEAIKQKQVDILKEWISQLWKI